MQAKQFCVVRQQNIIKLLKMFTVSYYSSIEEIATATYLKCPVASKRTNYQLTI